MRNSQFLTMKKLISICTLAIAHLPLAICAAFGGTNASVTFNTNTWQIGPPGILASNAAAISNALAGIGFTGGGGRANAITNNNAAPVTLNNTLSLSSNLYLPASGIIYSGSNNTLIQTCGNANFFAGSGAGTLTTTGEQNVAIGQGALSSLTTGIEDTAIGQGSLSELQTGGGNTACGDQALSFLQTGSNNIAVGISAGWTFLDGESGNIDIGSAGAQYDNNIIRIGSAQTDAYIAGALHPSGGMNSSNLTGTINPTNLPSLFLTNGATNVTLGLGSNSTIPTSLLLGYTNLIGVGDSIMYGSGPSTLTNGFLGLAANALGLSFVNVGQPGACVRDIANAVFAPLVPAWNNPSPGSIYVWEGGCNDALTNLPATIFPALDIKIWSEQVLSQIAWEAMYPNTPISQGTVTGTRISFYDVFNLGGNSIWGNVYGAIGSTHWQLDAFNVGAFSTNGSDAVVLTNVCVGPSGSFLFGHLCWSNSLGGSETVYVDGISNCLVTNFGTNFSEDDTSYGGGLVAIHRNCDRHLQRLPRLSHHRLFKRVAQPKCLLWMGRFSVETGIYAPRLCDGNHLPNERDLFHGPRVAGEHCPARHRFGAFADGA